MIERNRQPVQEPHIPEKNGFTLIELSIVLVIVGLLVIPLLQYYKLYTVEKKTIKTEEHIEKVVDALSVFIRRYPCPANRNLPPSHPKYGLEQCDAIPSCAATCLDPLDPSTCSFSQTKGICSIEIYPAVNSDNSNGNDKLLIGGVPYRYWTVHRSTDWGNDEMNGEAELIPGMQASYLLDGWGRKLTYVVTDTLANPFKENVHKDYRLGHITALNEHGDPTAGVNDDGQFAIISHGKNGLGAFTMEGESLPCGSGTTEADNCDYTDTTYVQALGVYESDSADYYDDITYFYLRAPTDIWYSLTDSNSNTSPHINNRNENFVGISNDNPQAKLDVAGTISANSVRTDSLCDENGANCFNPGIFAAVPTVTGASAPSSSPVCASGRIVTQLANGQVTCEYPTLGTTSGTANCPTGYFIESILTSGCIICSNNSTDTEVCP